LNSVPRAYRKGEYGKNSVEILKEEEEKGEIIDWDVSD
jgi:hypothetical protein